MTVIEEGELTDTQKKASKELSKQMVKQSDQDTDASSKKKSGR